MTMGHRPSSISGDVGTMLVVVGVGTILVVVVVEDVANVAGIVVDGTAPPVQAAEAPRSVNIVCRIFELNLEKSLVL